ncbi:MAG: FYDLN acid domain-containing protein [bacterium]
MTPTGPRHPKLGYKWSCFSCQAKFYDLGKEEPICPKCGADQRDRPPEEPRTQVETPKPKVVRPMAQLLDEEEPTPDVEEDIPIEEHAAAEMFDETDADEAGLDIDDVDLVDEADLDSL